MEPIKQPGSLAGQAGHLKQIGPKNSQNALELRVKIPEEEMTEQAKESFVTQETQQISVCLSPTALEPMTQKTREVSLAGLKMAMPKSAGNESIKNLLRTNMREFIGMLKEDKKEGPYYSEKLFGESDPSKIVKKFHNEEEACLATFEKFISEMHCEWSKAKDEMSESEMKQMQFIRAIILWSAIDAIKKQCPQFSKNGEFYFDIAMSGSANITSDIDFSVKFKNQFKDNSMELGGRKLQIEFIDEFNKQIENFFGKINEDRVFTSAVTLDINGYAQFYFPHAMTMRGAKRQDIQQLAGSLLMLKNNAPDVSKMVNEEIFKGTPSDLKLKLKEDFDKLNCEYELTYCIFFMRNFLIKNNIEDAQFIDEKINSNTSIEAFSILSKLCISSDKFDQNWIIENKLNIESIKKSLNVGEEFFIKIRQSACSYYKKDLQYKITKSDNAIKAISSFRKNSQRYNYFNMTEERISGRRCLLAYIYKQELLQALTEEVSIQGHELFNLMHPKPGTPEYQQKIQNPAECQKKILEKQLEILNLNIEIEECYLEQERLLQEEQTLNNMDPEYNIQRWKQLNEEADAALLETSVSSILSEAFAEECHIGEGAFRAVVEGSQGNAKKMLSPIQYLQAEIETVAFARLHAEKHDTPFFKLIEMSKYMLRNTEYNIKTEFSISVYCGTPVAANAPKEYRDNIFVSDMKELFHLRKLSKKEKLQEIEVANQAERKGLTPKFSILSSNVAMNVGNQLQAYQTVGFVRSIVDSFNMCERPILLI